MVCALLTKRPLSSDKYLATHKSSLAQELNTVLNRILQDSAVRNQSLLRQYSASCSAKLTQHVSTLNNS